MTTATPGVDDPADVSDAGGDAHVELLPQWFVVLLVVSLAAILGFGTVGLVLAVLGLFIPVPTLALGLAATVALVVVVAPWRIPAARDLHTQVPAALAAALVAGATAYAMRHHAEHVFLDRDPGGYMVTARWLASHHTLEFNARVGAFADATGLRYDSPAVYDRGGGDLYFQFSHFLPSLIAQARWLGGDRLMFLTPPVLGGIGLMSFYALATRFVRPWLALAALAALATDLVELHFMRDAYSELPTQAVLLAGLWLLTRRGVPRPAVAAFTGLLLGATVMARIDGPLYLVPIPLVVGATVLAVRGGDRAGRQRLAATAALVGGVVVAIVIGLFDVIWRSTAYFRYLGWLVLLQYVGLALACVVIGAVAWQPRRVASLSRLARGRIADAAAIAVAALLFAMWFVRSHLQHALAYSHKFITTLQGIEHLPLDGRRRYSEYSLVWHSWYLGWLTLAAGVVGIALLTRESLRGRNRPNGLVVAAFLPAAAVYLAKPSIFPDQIWVMRRFLPLIIPGFILWSFVIVDRLLDRRTGRFRIPARAAAVALLVAAIAWPIHTDRPVRGDTTQQGFLGPVERICHVVGVDAAVVVLQGESLDLVLPQTLRSYCDVPVASRIFDPESPGMNAAGFARLARAWKRQGRTLFVVADTPARIDHIIPGLTPIARITAFNPLFLSETLLRRPSGFRAEGFSITVAPVP